MKNQRSFLFTCPSELKLQLKLMYVVYSCVCWWWWWKMICYARGCTTVATLMWFSTSHMAWRFALFWFDLIHFLFVCLFVSLLVYLPNEKSTQQCIRDLRDIKDTHILGFTGRTETTTSRWRCNCNAISFKWNWENYRCITTG